MSLPLHPASYQPHVDTAFAVRLEDAPDRTLTLCAVKPRFDDEVQFAFALHFLGEGAVLPQQIYRLSHPALGEFDLFLVPVQKRRTGILYEAVFNLLRDEAP